MPERRFTYFIYARILVSFLFFAITFLLRHNEPASAEYPFSSGIIWLMLFSFLFSIASYLLLKIAKIRFFITYLQSIWDVMFVTLLLVFTGGMNSPYSFLYLLSIMNAGLLLGRREAIYTASLCGILYGALVDFHYFGMLESIGLDPIDARKGGSIALFYTIFLNLIGYILAAFITGYLAERARRSEQELHEKSVDYDELAQLNSMIVSNLETGLLTLTDDGRIRVFNPYLEQLTTVSQVEAYNKELIEIFPTISAIDSNKDRSNIETEYTNSEGGKYQLSYSVSTLIDSHGKPTGSIINLRDVTELHRMEAALKKRDRMALLGELSARMAHEIRNPLAAMSGSVQLLSLGGEVEKCDPQLLGIVQRESERLNALITDFLQYARPVLPQKEQLLLSPILDEIFILISADQRYNKVTFKNNLPLSLNVYADNAQIRQVLLNLLCNSADAMPDGGNVEIEGVERLNGVDGYFSSPIVEITVCDNGVGMTKETEAHLFEPFYTTKPQGTGLGLATTYRIIEAHGGIIHFKNLQNGGCLCTILLPAYSLIPSIHVGID